MITKIAWLLLITVSVILILAISALFWKPKACAEKQVQPQRDDGHSSFLNEAEREDHSLRKKRYLQEISIRWKDLELMLERYELNHSLLFHWKGLHGRKTVLFTVTEEEAGIALFEAVNNLNLSSLIPDMDFYIALPLSEDYREMSLELLTWFPDHNHLPDLVIRSKSGLASMPGLNGLEACITIGEKPSMLYEVKGDSQEADWMASLHERDLFEPVWSRQAERMYESIRRYLPWQIRLEIRFAFLYGKKGMQDLMQLLPASREWFLPKLDKRGDHLYVSALNGQILKDAGAKLEASALHSSISLHQVQVTRKRIFCDPEGENYQMVQNACQSSLQLNAVLPVLKERKENEEDYTPVETICFSPLNNGMSVTSSGAVSFYESVLRKGM